MELLKKKTSLNMESIKALVQEASITVLNMSSGAIICDSDPKQPSQLWPFSIFIPLYFYSEL